MKLFKRALPLCMALVMVLSMVTTPLTGTAMAAGYKPGQFTVQANHVSADQLHPFTSSQELIWDMIQELKAQNITQVKEEPDEDLVASVEEATEMTYETVKNTIATEGYKVADIANKIALEKGAITTEQYSKAARLIVAALLG
jgi:predicted membrane-bound dolichyl-phosphate-mannose-protein mannosyltransferase